MSAIGSLLRAVGISLLGPLVAAGVAAAPAPGQPMLQIEVGTHAGPVRRLAVDPARDLAVTVSDDKSARVWRLGSGELLRILRVPAGEADLGRLYGVALHPTDGSVAVGGTAHAKVGQGKRADIFVFDLQTGRLLRRIDAGPGEIKRLAWTADGTLLIAGTEGHPQVSGETSAVLAFDSAGRQVLRQRAEGAVYGIDVARDGRVVATDASGALNLFQSQGAALQWLRRLPLPSPGPVSVALSPDGERALVGYFASQKPTLVELAEGRTLRTLVPRGPVDAGYLSTVAWSADGRSAYAAGATRIAGGRVGVWRFDADSGAPQAAVEAALDSVTDLVGLGGQRACFTSFDGSWGCIEGGAVAQRVDSAVPELRDAESLRADARGLVVEWSVAGATAARRFDVSRRGFVPAAAGIALQGAVTHQGLLGRRLQTTDTAGRLPYFVVGGQRFPLETGELAISGTFLGGSGEALIGTSRALLRVNREGRIAQRLETGAEVNSLVPARDGALAISAMGDGSLRWWRTRDLQLVLTLVPTRRGAWIAWTPAGYYDASTGADTLAGWLFSRPEVGEAELQALGRFRDTFMRPDIVDQALQTLDPVAAAAQAPPSEREFQRPRPPAATPAGAQALTLALAPLDLLSLRSETGQVTLRYALRAGASMPVSVQASVDGLPVDARVDLPAALDGRSAGRVELRLAAGRRVVNLVAHSPQDGQDSLTFTVDVSPQAAPAPEARTLAPKPRLFVLAVGISDYQTIAYRLKLAAKDAADFSDAVELQRGRHYRSVEVMRLLDRQATRTRVLEGLQWLTRSAGPEDVVMLFMAGHGINVHSRQYYFLPADGDATRLAETAVPELKIREALTHLRGRAIFFVDTCHAGAAVGQAGSADPQVKRMLNELVASAANVVVLASSEGRQDSEEADAWGNGAFTRALVQGLRGGAAADAQGRIWFKSLDKFVSDEVRALTAERQTPVSHFFGAADFVLASR